MSLRDQLNSYIQQLERRLRLGAMLRGGRDPHFCCAGHHRNSRSDHQCVCLFALEHYQRARGAAVCAGAGRHVSELHCL